MQVRDRIREFRRVPASQLRPNPKNWRVHPPAQQDALRGLLAEVGYADALLTRTLPDGALELIDGHLRAETTPDMEVPVLVLDLTEEEADKLLALHDPLAAMAEANVTLLAELLSHVESGNQAVKAALGNLAERHGIQSLEEVDRQAAELEIPSLFQVVAECADEAAQQALFERLNAEGYRCRVLTL